MKKILILVIAVLLSWGCAAPDENGSVALDGPVLESMSRDGNLEFNGVVVNSGNKPVHSVYVVMMLRDKHAISCRPSLRLRASATDLQRYSVLSFSECSAPRPECSLAWLNDTQTSRASMQTTGSMNGNGKFYRLRDKRFSRNSKNLLRKGKNSHEEKYDDHDDSAALIRS